MNMNLNTLNLDKVNVRCSREWVLFNGNSHEKKNRQALIDKYGGHWEQNKRNKEWIWHPRAVTIVNFPEAKKPRPQFEFTHKDGKIIITDNFTGFCRENNVNASAMHEVLSGKRKQFKGYTVKRIPPKDN